MYRLRILVNDRPIPIYNDKEGQLWVEARENTNFSIKVENNSYKRVLAVVSVDGLNIINAKHEDPMHSPGYVIDQYNKISIPGWNISDKEVREFVFTGKEDSYASKIGADQSNVGIIGVAIISQQEPQYHWYVGDGYSNTSRPHFPEPTRWHETYFTVTSNNTGTVRKNATLTNFSASVDSADIKREMAVGSGAKQDFATTEFVFNRNKVETILTVRYDSKENLIKKGIMIEQGPVPFPINSPYCPDV